MFTPTSTIDKKTRKLIGELQSSKGYIRVQNWNTTPPAAAAATAVHTDITTAVVTTTGITNPDVPRVLSVVEGGATHTATGNVVIAGTDIRGNAITDTITLNGNTTVNGAKAFKTVTSIDTTGVTGIGAASTVQVGIAAKLGLDRLYDVDAGIKCTVDKALDTLTALTYDAVNISGNFYTPTTAPNGVHTYRLYTICTELTGDKNTTS